MPETEYKNVIFDVSKTKSEILSLGANSIIKGQVWIASDTKEWIWRKKDGTFHYPTARISDDVPTDGNYYVRRDGSWFDVTSVVNDSHNHSNKSILDLVEEAYTTAEKNKLAGIEDGATADQTAIEIKTLYESNADTNVYTDSEKTKLAGIETGAEVNAVDSVAGKTGVVTLDKSDVGLDQVDNTSDLNKPISNATQAALDLKADATLNPVYDSVQFTGGTGDQGTMNWNADEETVDLIQNGATLQLGQEFQIHCRNNTGVTIADGTPVMATGTLGASGRITIAPFDPTVDVKLYLGITTEEILNGEDGKVSTDGKVRSIDTTGSLYGETWNDGDVIYLSPSTAGYLTNVEPVYGEIKIATAFIIHSDVNGTLYVRSTNHNENDRYPYADLKDPTGFIDSRIGCSYDSVNRTITLNDSGSHIVRAMYQGAIKSDLVDGWESPAHPLMNDGDAYFLYWDGTQYVWDLAPFISNLYETIQIALVRRVGTEYVCIKETHSVMDNKAHKEFHNTIGTWVIDRGGFSGYVANSTTLADKQLSVGAYTLADEDNETELPLLTGGNGAYSHFFISGSNVANLTSSNNEIVTVGGNGRPEYDEYNGSTWSTVQTSNNDYVKVFIMAIPVGSDASSQLYRYVFIRPQSATASLDACRSIGSASVNLGNIGDGSLPEYNFIGEVILRASTNNYEIVEVNDILGTRFSQVVTSTSVPNLNSVVNQGGEVDVSGYGILDRVVTVIRNGINQLTIWGDGKLSALVAEIATLSANIINGVTGNITTLNSSVANIGSPVADDASLNVGASSIAESYNSTSTDPTNDFNVANYIEDTVTGELFSGYKTWKDPLSNKRLRIVASFNGGGAFSWALTNETTPTQYSVIHQDGSNSYFQATANLSDNTTGSYSGSGTYAGYQAGVGYTPAQSGKSIHADGVVVTDATTSDILADTRNLVNVETVGDKIDITSQFIANTGVTVQISSLVICNQATGAVRGRLVVSASGVADSLFVTINSAYTPMFSVEGNLYDSIANSVQSCSITTLGAIRRRPIGTPIPDSTTYIIDVDYMI